MMGVACVTDNQRVLFEAVRADSYGTLLALESKVNATTTYSIVQIFG